MYQIEEKNASIKHVLFKKKYIDFTIKYLKINT
jgi:hypothetical protein